MHPNGRRFVLSLPYYIIYLKRKQVQKSHATLQEQIAELATIVNEAEDGIFKAFCHKIKVHNIREYEERQLKMAQEESKARLQYETQISRLTHQYDFLFILAVLGFANRIPQGLSLRRKVLKRPASG